MNSVSAFDVAAHLRGQLGEIGRVRLHKLLYLAQGWHLAWFDEPLFQERIEAWAMGPVVAEVDKAMKYDDLVPGDQSVVGERGRAVLRFVIAEYGRMTGVMLSELSHKETPWLETRALHGAGPSELCDAPIAPELLLRYFKSRAGSDQSWYWNSTWQSKESEAASELDNVRQVLDADDFLALL